MEGELDRPTEFESGTRRFYKRVRAACVGRVLDFGAGCGSWFDRPAERVWRDLRGLAEVWACDIDPAVLDHPAADHRYVLVERTSLPFGDDSFDLILCDYVFEHLSEPSVVASELMRVLRPGGLICARTANRWGYPAIAARLVPNRLHRAVLRWVQPGRETRDVFATRYLMNRPKSVALKFGPGVVDYYFDSAEPAYFFGNKLIRSFFSYVHHVLPDNLATGFCCFITKR